jgi:hypothetical protein
LTVSRFTQTADAHGVHRRDRLHPFGVGRCAPDSTPGRPSGVVAPPCRWLTCASSRLASQSARRTRGRVQLRNLGFNRLLHYWRKIDGNRRFAARVVNYADDFVILSRGKAEAALVRPRDAMKRLGLQLE